MPTDVLEPIAFRAAVSEPSRKPNKFSPTGTGSISRPQWAFDVDERWEGRVEEIHDTYFLATIENLATGKRASVRIATTLVTPDDRERFHPGNLFYWHFGHRQPRRGQIEQVSTIRFRRSLGTKELDQGTVDFWLQQPDRQR